MSTNTSVPLPQKATDESTQVDSQQSPPSKRVEVRVAVTVPIGRDLAENTGLACAAFTPAHISTNTFESTRIGLIVADGHTGQMVCCQPGACQIDATIHVCPRNLLLVRRQRFVGKVHSYIAVVSATASTTPFNPIAALITHSQPIAYL